LKNFFSYGFYIYFMENNLYNYRISITKVIDGDTVVADVDLGFRVILRDQRIRLARINAPEMHGESKQQGELSKVALMNKIFGKKVTMRSYKSDREKYGRLLGELYLEDGTCVNDWLVSESLAKAFMV